MMKKHQINIISNYVYDFLDLNFLPLFVLRFALNLSIPSASGLDPDIPRIVSLSSYLIYIISFTNDHDQKHCGIEYLIADSIIYRVAQKNVPIFLWQ